MDTNFFYISVLFICFVGRFEAFDELILVIKICVCVLPALGGVVSEEFGSRHI